MMTLRPVTLWGLAAAASTAAVAILLYNRLPATIPIHWGVNGGADGFLPKPFGAFLYPATIAIAALLGTALPALSPRKFEITAFADAFDVIILALIGFITFIALAIDAQALGLPVATSHLVGPGTGVLLIAIGNIMSKTRRNFFVGFRTPWTLANEEVWLRTHRFGGRLFVLCGFIFCAASAFGIGLAVPAVAVLVTTVVIFAYSYLVYRKLGPEV